MLSEVLEQGIDVMLHLLRHHAEMVRLLAQEITEEEVIGWPAGGPAMRSRRVAGTAVGAAIQAILPSAMRERPYSCHACVTGPTTGNARWRAISS